MKKERRSNKTNHMIAIDRRKQKQAEKMHSTEKSQEQVFSDVPNKDTFGPKKLSHITGNGLRGSNRQSPLGNYGAS